jgi:hypothetical protein
MNTGSAAMTVNLDNIANITTDAVTYTTLSGTIGNITLDDKLYTDLFQARLEFCVYGVEDHGNGEVYYYWREYLGDTKINANKSWAARIRPLGSSETVSINVIVRDPNDPDSWYGLERVKETQVNYGPQTVTGISIGNVAITSN